MLSPLKIPYRENTTKLTTNIKSVFSYLMGGCGNFTPTLLPTMSSLINAFL